MGNRRCILFFIGVLIMAPVIMAAVSGAPTFTDPADPDMVWYNSTDLFNASFTPQKPASHTFSPAGPVPGRPAVAAGALIMAPGPAALDSIGPGDSLQDAIYATPDGGTVWLDPGVYHEHSILIDRNIVIRSNASAGGSRGNTIIDAYQEGRIFSVTGAYSLTLSDLTLQNGTDPDSGGAVFAPYGGDLVVTNTAFENFSATGGAGNSAGGAIYADLGTVTITSSSFYNCSADAWGGAIESHSSLTITSSIFENCSALDGGAVDFYEMGATIDSTTFENCSAVHDGGAIWGSGLSTLVLTSSTFVNCSAEFGGAIVLWDTSTLTIASSTFGNCTAREEGGAIWSGPNGTLTMTGSAFVNCTAQTAGGAVSFYGTDATIHSTSFGNCSAPAGGAIISEVNGTLTISSSTFENCSADAWGGAVFSNGYVTVTATAFENCSAPAGGAVFGDGDLSITASTFETCSAMGGGAIVALSNLSVTSSTFTGCSAFLYGGAIYTEGPNAVTIASSTFTNCSSDTTGGAIMGVITGTLTVTSSTFTGCSAHIGGAISAYLDDTVTLTGNTFTGCSAQETEFYPFPRGGAIDIYHCRTVTIASSVFSNCSAGSSSTDGYGGAIYLREGNMSISGSTITGCRATGSGGAIVLLQHSSLNVTSSSITGCSAGYGGGIFNDEGTLDLTSSTITGCSATADGGGIANGMYGIARITSSTITNCNAAGSGGAIRGAAIGTLTITSSTITGCSAASGGGAVYAGTVTMHFCRVYHNGGNAVNTGSGDTTNNWWGRNSGPAAGEVTGSPFTPWLVLGITATPSSITVPQTSYIRTNLTYTSDGTNTAGGGIFVPNAIANAYAIVSGPGILAPVTAGTGNGVAQTTYITLQPGTTTISGTVDDQTMYVTLGVAQGTWTPGPTVVPNDDGWPSGGSGGGVGGSAATTGSSGFPLMTVTVNIGGDSKAWQAIVTGTKLSELIVTGTEQHDSGGSNCTPPAGITFQYLSLEPARYDTITNAIINFTVPQSWLDANHIAPGSVVLFRMTPDCWEALPTTILYTKDGTVYFSAQSGGFSRFAIAGTPGVLTPPGVVTTQEPVSTMAVQEQVTAPAAVAKSPVTTRTTAPSAPVQVPAKSSPFPLVPVVAVICCIGLIGGGWYLRRWWIRRQNPALFAEDD